MAKPKDQKKSQGPKKAQVAKKAEIDKLVQDATLAKNVKQPKQQVPRPFKPRAKQPQYAIETPFTRDEAGPIDVPENLGQIIVRLPSKEFRKPIKPTKPFPFLKLPQELQDQVYGYLFDHPLTFHVKFVSQKCKALTYCLPNQPAEAQPKVKESAWRRRRQLDWPRRIKSNEKDIPAYKLPTGFLSLLHVHPRIAAGAAKYFYRLHTFRFAGMRALQAFLDMIPTSSKEAIQSLELIHHTFGFGWTPCQIWKVKYDNYWENTLWRVGIELTGLRNLKMDVRINDIPVDFGPESAWRMPFEALTDMDLRRVKINVNTLLKEHKDAMEVESYLIEQELLAEKYRDGYDAVERCSDAVEPERLLPVAKRGPVKILNITMPGYPRRA